MNTLRLLVALVIAVGLSCGAVPGHCLVKSDPSVTSTAGKLVEKQAAKQEETKGGKKIPALGSVDINKAEKDELITLPGVGPTTAEAILQYRQANGAFTSQDDLMNVKGIGAKTMAKLKQFLKKI
jgi:comEA protein